MHTFKLSNSRMNMSVVSSFISLKPAWRSLVRFENQSFSCLQVQRHNAPGPGRRWGWLRRGAYRLFACNTAEHTPAQRPDSTELAGILRDVWILYS